MNSKDLLGKEVIVKNKDSLYYKKSGVIINFDDYYYWVVFPNPLNLPPQLFKRNEFRVVRNS